MDRCGRSKPEHLPLPDRAVTHNGTRPNPQEMKRFVRYRTFFCPQGLVQAVRLFSCFIFGFLAAQKCDLITRRRDGGEPRRSNAHNTDTADIRVWGFGIIEFLGEGWRWSVGARRRFVSEFFRLQRAFGRGDVAARLPAGLAETWLEHGAPPPSFARIHLSRVCGGREQWQERRRVVS